MYKEEKKVTASEIGQNGKVRLSRLLDIIQDTCSFQLDNCKVTQEFYKRYNAATFLMFWQVDILDELKYGDEIEVSTYVYQMKKTYGERNFFIRDKSNKLLIRGAGGGANVDKDTKKLVPMPKDLLDIYPLEKKHDMNYLSRKIHFQKDTKVDEFEPLKVMGHLIDNYGHINNARYLDICEEYIPIDFNVKRFIISYNMQAKQGDIMHPVRYTKEGEVGIALNDKQGEHYIKLLLLDSL